MRVETNLRRARLVVLGCVLAVGAGACGSGESTNLDSDSSGIVTTTEPTVALFETTPSTVALDTAATVRAATVSPTTVVTKATAPASTTPPTDASPTVYYGNCDAARQAGDTPLYEGDPGYRSGLDRDHDGVACE